MTVFDAPEHRAARWAELAMRRMGEAIRHYLGMELNPDGSVSVPGVDRPRRTVDLLEPFGHIAHNVQLLRLCPARTLAFYEVYAACCHHMGRRAASFDGQVEAFTRAIETVACEPVPQLRRVA